MLYKIICCDNFDRESVAEYFINLPSMTKEKADTICSILNMALCSEHSDECYRVVDKDYILWRGLEERV